MLSGLFSVVMPLVVLFGFGWLSQEIAARIPNRTTKALLTFGARTFTAGGDVDSYFISEFKVQFSDNWEIGHELNVIAMGTVSLYREWTEEDDKNARIYVQFFPNEEACAGTDQIGWATVNDHEEHGKYVSVRLLLRGSIIATLVNELRRSTDHYLHVSGFENEKGVLAITSFSLSPK